MSGIQKLRLNNLNPNIKNALIVGIIIAKNTPRLIGSKKKNGESRGVTSFTLRDSDVDTINVDVWGSEYYVLTFYERFLVGDVGFSFNFNNCISYGNIITLCANKLFEFESSLTVIFQVEISSPKICVKSGGNNENFRPQVSSPFYLSLNEGQSDVTIYSGDTFGAFLPLLHIPTKSSSGYHGLAEVLKLPEQNNTFVDLLVVVKSVKPAKQIKTKAGVAMSVRSVEIMDNTTPATLTLDIFDMDTIQRAEEWKPLESVLFIADARVSWRGRATLQAAARSVITHQPHTADAEALRLYMRNQASTSGGEAAAWAAWSGERAAAASVSQVRDRLAAAAPFTASLHAVCTHLDLEELVQLGENQNSEEIRVRFADHTGELSARVPFNILEESLGYKLEVLKAMNEDDRSALKWKFLLEQCTVKLASSPPRLLVLSLRRATPTDPIPLY